MTGTLRPAARDADADDIDIGQLDIPALRSLDKSTAERLVKQAGRKVRWYWYALLGWGLTIAALAIFTPVNVLDRWTWAAAFVQQMTDWFPFLGKHARHSQFPQVVSFVKSASFALLLPATVTGWLLFWGYRRVGLAALVTGVRPPFLKGTTELILVACYALGFFGIWFLPGDPGFMKGFTTTSRWGLALIDGGGFLFMAMIPGLLAFFLFLRVSSHHLRLQ